MVRPSNGMASSDSSTSFQISSIVIAMLWLLRRNRNYDLTLIMLLAELVKLLSAFRDNL